MNCADLDQIFITLIKLLCNNNFKVHMIVLSKVERRSSLHWRDILEVPESCSKVALRCEPQITGMKWRVWQAKCFLLKQILHLEDDALAKEVCQMADENRWPGLKEEVRNICKQIGIQDIGNYNVSKAQIQEAIFNSHYRNMKEQLKSSKKLDDIKNEDFRKTQPYFLYKSVQNGRLSFRIRTKMVKKIPGIFLKSLKTLKTA